jgi:hypothetical protein
MLWLTFSLRQLIFGPTGSSTQSEFL